MKHSKKNMLCQWLIVIFVAIAFGFFMKFNLIIGGLGLVLQILWILAVKPKDAYLLW